MQPKNLFSAEMSRFYRKCVALQLVKLIDFFIAWVHVASISVLKGDEFAFV